MLQTYERNAHLKLVSTLVAVLVVAGVVMLADYLKSRPASLRQPATTAQTAMQTAATAPAPTPTAQPSPANTSGFKDGTYSATSDYYVPPGQESIRVNLTLTSGTITNISIQNSEGDRDSALFQEDFASQYKQYVVGKKITNLRLDVIAGASDTTQGFIDALNQIAAKAQA